jgi:hypothetical protein
VQKIISKKNPQFILFNGHGSDDLITGHEFEPIIRIEDAPLIQNRIVFARACNTSKVLGEICGKNGTGAYIGFNDKFRFWTSGNTSHSPLNDPYAQIIIDPTNVIAKSLLKGNSVMTAVLHGKEAYKKNIQLLEESDSKKELHFLLSALYWNLSKLCIHGNIDANLC